MIAVTTITAAAAGTLKWEKDEDREEEDALQTYTGPTRYKQCEDPRI